MSFTQRKSSGPLKTAQTRPLRASPVSSISASHFLQQPPWRKSVAQLATTWATKARLAMLAEAMRNGITTPVH